ncbi:tetratricopeptide repeat protein 1 like protein [Babesia gibsoni]|uniref:Tetratricopeptide repeat protein 1 like protein n=1 Tax=Babesia gibsoni TaxID=33632 RepID=A0AAD8PDL5_BABGI|nr:tetratricopeptide repeat protein 1 like protein [Babesia gibsoni]
MSISEIVNPVERVAVPAAEDPSAPEATSAPKVIAHVENQPESDAEKLKDSGCTDLFGRQSPEFLKERGNNAFRDADFVVACELYTTALSRLEFSDNDTLKAQLYANRAACHIALDQYDLAINDATDAILLDSVYMKAYLRRSTAYEKKGINQKACSDLEKAIQLDPSIESKYRSKVVKLKALAEKEFLKEKDEMIGKLKDLGNTLLGKVGLSLDNFKVNKDEATGSYNIQFQN